MQVRIFEAADMATGLKMVKKELGPDALILSTRTVRNGKMGLGKPVLEITAAIDANFDTAYNGGKQPARLSLRADESVAEYLQPDSVAGSGRSPDGAAAPRGNAGVLQQDLRDEVYELKNLVKSLAGQINQLADRDHKALDCWTALKAKNSTSASRTPRAPLHWDPVLSMLTDRGVNVETATAIAGFVRESVTDEELVTPDNAAGLIRSAIEGLVVTAPPCFQSGGGCHRIALTGPTGVGKTTTLAKIAASYLRNHSGSIALITIDTYRIAAVEQLKVYGEIMHLPVEVVITPDQLEQAMEKHSGKEIILIDTAGRSPKDSFSIDELASFLKPELNIEKHLVLSATTRENELLDIINRFSRLTIDKTIVTKIDECTDLGMLLNLQMQNPSPLSYITNGQRVPEDLLEVNPEIVADLIMSHYQGTMHD